MKDAVKLVLSSTVSGAPFRPLNTYSFPSLKRTWQRVLDAFDGLPAKVVATTGPAIDID